MSFLDEKSIIETYFQTQWAGECPVYFENVSADESVMEWVRLTLQNSDSFQASLGSDPAFRYKGVLFFQVFQKPDTGSGRAMELVDKISALFRAKTISGITFRVPVVRKVPTNAEWYQVNVSIEFFRGE